MQRMMRILQLASLIAVVQVAFPLVAADRGALPDPLIAGWEGRQVCELLLDDGRQRVLRCTFAPGDGHERHFHAPHVGYVLAAGRMQITDATGTREVVTPTGSTWTSEGIEWHEVLNVGPTTAIYLIVEPRTLPTE